MIAFHIDAKTGQQLPPTAVQGTTGFISWKRLAQLIKSSDELRANESLISIQVDDRGLTYRIGFNNGAVRPL